MLIIQQWGSVRDLTKDNSICHDDDEWVKRYEWSIPRNDAWLETSYWPNHQ